MGVLTEVIRVVVHLWQLLLGLVISLFSVLVGYLPAPVAVLLASLPAFLVGVLLFGVATALNARGVADVHATIYRALYERGRDSGKVPEVSLPEPDPEEVTDDQGRFSSSAFQTATGLTPHEFVHLFVTANGGRVYQTTLNRYLPWSKATVSRYLDELEAEEVVVRVTIRGRNVVCLPEDVPRKVAPETA